MEIRPAELSDCLFVARGICMALHMDPTEEELPLIANICQREDVLYSYKNTLIAWEGDTPLGICLCYDGKGYHEIRLRTFALFQQMHEALGEKEIEDDLDFEHFEDETCEGEYYIDSLAVMPEFRRRGIATQLLKAQINKGSQLGLPVATLLVDPDNPDAQKLYYNCGFKYREDVYAFGQIFWKLALTL